MSHDLALSEFILLYAIQCVSQYLLTHAGYTLLPLVESRDFSPIAYIANIVSHLAIKVYAESEPKLSVSGAISVHRVKETLNNTNMLLAMVYLFSMRVPVH